MAPLRCFKKTMHKCMWTKKNPPIVLKLKFESKCRISGMKGYNRNYRVFIEIFISWLSVVESERCDSSSLLCCTFQLVQEGLVNLVLLDFLVDLACL